MDKSMYKFESSLVKNYMKDDYVYGVWFRHLLEVVESKDICSLSNNSKHLFKDTVERIVKALAFYYDSAVVSGVAYGERTIAASFKYISDDLDDSIVDDELNMVWVARMRMVCAIFESHVFEDKSYNIILKDKALTVIDSADLSDADKIDLYNIFAVVIEDNNISKVDMDEDSKKFEFMFKELKRAIILDF